jgi:uncharacterized lipoprotein YmbA
MQSRGTARSPPPGDGASPKLLTNVAYLQFATEQVWAQNPDSQPTTVYLSHKLSVATKVLVFGMTTHGPQTDFNVVSVTVTPVRV